MRYWDGFGRKPGPIRNAEVIANSDEVVAFWGRESPGTLNALVQARDVGLPITIFDPDGAAIPIETVMQARAKHILRRCQRASSEGPCQGIVKKAHKQPR